MVVFVLRWRLKMTHFTCIVTIRYIYSTPNECESAYIVLNKRPHIDVLVQNMGVNSCYFFLNFFIYLLDSHIMLFPLSLQLVGLTR